MKTTETVNINFKALRKKAGLTLDELADRAEYSVAAINGLENNDAGSKRLRSRVFTVLSAAIPSLPLRAAVALANQSKGSPDERQDVFEEVSARLIESDWRMSTAQKKLDRIRLALVELVEMIDDEDSAELGHSALQVPEGSKSSKRKRSDIAAVSLAIYGNLPAGWPQERDAAQRPTRLVKVARGKFPEGAFALEVRGDSMNAAQPKPILDGDVVVLVSPERREPKSGDIVAALVDGETTLKRLVNGDEPAHLKSESTDPAFHAIHPVRELIIQGVVIGKL